MEEKYRNEEKEREESEVPAVEKIADGDKYTLRMLSVIGHIEGHSIISDGKTTKYEQVLPVLCSIEEDPTTDGLLVLLNTVGGDVEAGLAIAEMLAGMSKPTVSLVIGGGHSIAVPIAVACRRSLIVPSATMTLHPVRINGTVLGTPQSFSYLAKMQSRINRFILSHSAIGENELNRLLMNSDELATDIGTILCGDEAVKAGLIGAVGGISDALKTLKSLIDCERAEQRPATGAGL